MRLAGYDKLQVKQTHQHTITTTIGSIGITVNTTSSVTEGTAAQLARAQVKGQVGMAHFEWTLEWNAAPNHAGGKKMEIL